MRIKFFPLKYKFLLLLLGLLLSALLVFFAFTYRTFAQDKKLFVLDLNLALLDAANSSVTEELRTRIEELRGVLSHYNPGSKWDPFQSLSDSLGKEVLRVSFYKLKGAESERLEQFVNKKVLADINVSSNIFVGIDNHPFNVNVSEPLGFANRSVEPQQNNKGFPVLTLLLRAKELDGKLSKTVMAIDLLQSFLTKALKHSEIAEIFLVTKEGWLLSHSSEEMVWKNSSQKFDHPLVKTLSKRKIPKESSEVKLGREGYLCSLAKTPFSNIFIFSQVSESEAFVALHRLTKQSLIWLVGVAYVVFLIGILASRGLTSHIQKLKAAVEQVGEGNFNVKLSIHSRDEIEKVAESFETMATKIRVLMSETAQKTRMEEELKTASLVQSTLLNPTEQRNPDRIEMVPFYTAASECGGDFWDYHFDNSKLTVVLGDATGHGASAAIVTAVAKSCFSTLSVIHPESLKQPHQFVSNMNQIIYSACKGKLLMTLCLLQIDTQTGELLVCNAGHEAPFLVPKSGKKPEALFVRGERLGFDPSSRYETSQFQLEIGDKILLYTDGVSEAIDPDGKEWGERALRKSLVSFQTLETTVLKDRLVQAINAHRRGAAQVDDITFIVLKWLDQPKRMAA